MAMNVRAAVVSSKGCVRGNNEDNFYFNGDLMELGEMDAGASITHTFTDSCQFYAIADGMGGGDHGERASAIAVKQMLDEHKALRTGDPRQTLDAYARRINEIIRKDGLRNGSDTEGSTLAALCLRDGQAYVANVGDSRVYMLQNGRLLQVSMDHSAVANLMRAGQLTAEQARKAPNNNVITRYLGMDASEIGNEYVYQSNGPVAPGFRFMLCSDGVCDLISNDRLQSLLLMDKDPLDAASRLVSTALEEGGKDNTTCMVVDLL